MLSRLKTLIPIVLAIAVSGCGGGGKPAHIPDLVPFSVKVTHKGAAVDGAKVIFSPKNGQFSAAGQTDAAGVAVMMTEGEYSGVVPGEYMVQVSKYEILNLDFGPVPSDPKEYAEYEKKLKSQPKPKSLLPEKYASFTKSGLTASVAAGATQPHELVLAD